MTTRQRVLVRSCASAQLVACYKYKVFQSGVILIVASQFTSVDTIGNTVSVTVEAVLLGSAPAELVRNGLPNVSPGARSARQFEALSM